MSKRLASEVEQDGVAATAQAVWALITGQRNQIEGLEAATSGPVGDQSAFFQTARGVSKSSRLAIDSQTVRIPVVVYPYDAELPTYLTTRVSPTLADQLDEAAQLPNYAEVTGPVAQFVASHANRDSTLWVVSRHRTTMYNFINGTVRRFGGYTREYGLRQLNIDLRRTNASFADSDVD